MSFRHEIVPKTTNSVFKSCRGPKKLTLLFFVVENQTLLFFCLKNLKRQPFGQVTLFFCYNGFSRILEGEHGRLAEDGVVEAVEVVHVVARRQEEEAPQELLERVGSPVEVPDRRRGTEVHGEVVPKTDAVPCAQERAALRRHPDRPLPVRIEEVVAEDDKVWSTKLPMKWWVGTSCTLTAVASQGPVECRRSRRSCPPRTPSRRGSPGA